MRTVAVLIGGALVLGACDRSATKAPEAGPKQPTTAELLHAQDAKAFELVKAHLKDPDSARFRNVRRVPFMGMPSEAVSKVYCGEVNARNSMGGYSGYSAFVAQPDKSEVNIVEGDDLSARFSYDVLCMKDEKPIEGVAITLGS